MNGEKGRFDFTTLEGAQWFSDDVVEKMLQTADSLRQEGHDIRVEIVSQGIGPYGASESKLYISKPENWENLQPFWRRKVDLGSEHPENP